MKTCLVSLVSDQTIPNVLVAMHRRPDLLLLVSTPGMEKKHKSHAILETLKLRSMDYSERHHVLEVEENSIVDFQARVGEWVSRLPEEYHFVVNLTGGTKLMSIAAYDLFTDFGSEMLYLPIPRNEVLTPFPKHRPRVPTAIPERLSVEEYLTAYGFQIQNRDQIAGMKEEAHARAKTTRYLYDQYKNLRPLLAWFFGQLRPLDPKKLKKGREFSGEFRATTETEAALLEMVGFQCKGTTLSKKIFDSDRKYLCGGWLEERIFLAAEASLPDGCDVLPGVQCRDPGGSPNEFDTLFIHDNVLYVIECKSLDAAEGSDQIMGGTVNDFLYKLGALRRNFGITPKAFLATTDKKILTEQDEVKRHLVERGRQFGTEIMPLLLIPDLEAHFKGLFPA